MPDFTDKSRQQNKKLATSKRCNNTSASVSKDYTSAPIKDAGSPSLDAPEHNDVRKQAAGYRITPMFEQYLEVKEQYPDALLFYRMGDFYELFFEDATTAARELQLALTSRSRECANPIPMCGIPWHALEGYAAQLIDKGYSLAICDQTEDPRQAKGLVSRAVTRVITPGTVLDDANLTTKQHNYLGALYTERGQSGFIWADISTGQWSGTTAPEANCWQWLLKFTPKELLIQDDLILPKDEDLSGIRLVRRRKNAFDLRQAEERILDAQKVRELGALGLQNQPLLVHAAGALLAYLAQTQKRNPDHMLPFRPLDTGQYLLIDDVTERNLELFRRLNGTRGRGTLLSIMDSTMTPMGGRYLEDMLHNPLRDISAITTIQDVVTCFLTEDIKREVLRHELAGVFDLERLSTRIHMNRALPKDFIALRNSLAALPKVFKALKAFSAHPSTLETLLSGWDGLEDCAILLDRALLDPPPQVITEGGIFKAGYDKELDYLLDLSEHGEQKLKEIFEQDQKRCGGMRLKLGNNRVFGYYYEISHAQKTGNLPEDFIRRQTLVSGERYTTPALKKLEDDILQASERRKTLEYHLFQTLRGTIATARTRLLAISTSIARLDYWQSLAEKARQNNWTKPQLTSKPELYIQEGRHPVVEEIIGQPNFVPNSFTLDKTRRLCLLTGPNMAGKSTIIRQTAIICLMAQMGSFIPAASAKLGIVDRLFSRVGATDNLTQGQSTFLVEMMETARILRQATRHSLIILDEIGRGTSTYDGLAIAWAVAEDLAQRFDGSLRTLFATHYHELTQLEGQIPGIFTMNIAIREYKKNIIFLHKLVPGPTDKSYGIEVARLAGIPRSVVSRARELLELFESLKNTTDNGQRTVTTPSILPGLKIDDFKPELVCMNKHRMQARPGNEQPLLPRSHPLVQILTDLNPETLTPVAALNLIAEWKKIWAVTKTVQEKKFQQQDSAHGIVKIKRNDT